MSRTAIIPIPSQTLKSPYTHHSSLNTRILDARWSTGIHSHICPLSSKQIADADSYNLDLIEPEISEGITRLPNQLSHFTFRPI